MYGIVNSMSVFASLLASGPIADFVVMFVFLVKIAVPYLAESRLT
jgi:hypothetical protein